MDEEKIRNRIERKKRAKNQIELLVSLYDYKGRFHYCEVPGTCEFGNCYGKSRWYDSRYEDSLCGDCLRKRLIGEYTFYTIY